MMINVCWLNVLWLDKIVFLNKYWVKFFFRFMRGKMVDSGEKNLVGSSIDVIGVVVIFNVGSFNIFFVIV